MAVLKGEPLAASTAWPPSLLAALRQWGTTQPRAPCLTALDTAGKATCTLTYGKCQQKAVRLRLSRKMLRVTVQTCSWMHLLEQDTAGRGQKLASPPAPPRTTALPSSSGDHSPLVVLRAPIRMCISEQSLVCLTLNFIQVTASSMYFLCLASFGSILHFYMMRIMHIWLNEFPQSSGPRGTARAQARTPQLRPGPCWLGA